MERGGMPGSGPLWNPRYNKVGMKPQWKAVLQMVITVLILTRAPCDNNAIFYLL